MAIWFAASKASSGVFVRQISVVDVVIIGDVVIVSAMGPDLGAILIWLKYRKIQRNKKIAEKALLEINSLTVTIHGRQMLSAMCLDNDSDLRPEIRRMYWALLKTAPVSEYAEWN